MTDQEFQNQVIDRLARIEERALRAAEEIDKHRSAVKNMERQVSEIHAKVDAAKPLLTATGLLQFLGVAVLAAAGAAGSWLFGKLVQ